MSWLQHPFQSARELLVDYPPEAGAGALKSMRESEQRAPAIFRTIGNIMGNTRNFIHNTFWKLPIAGLCKAATSVALVASGAASAVRATSDGFRYGVNTMADHAAGFWSRCWRVITGKKEAQPAGEHA